LLEGKGNLVLPSPIAIAKPANEAQQQQQQ
jgi:hypothetical protein